MSNKSEIRKLIEAFELVLNEEDEAADELMHQYFVSLARRINEELEDEEIAEDSLDYDMEDDLTGEIRSDMDEIESEEGVAEDDDMEYGGEGDMEGDVEGDMEFDMEMGAEGGEADLGDLIVSVEDAFNELKSEFERLSGEDLDGGDMEYGGEGDMDYEGDEDMDDMDYEDGGDMDMDYEGSEEETEESMFEDDDEDLDEEDKDELDEEKDEDLDENDDDEDLDESVALSSVAAPSNSEGKEIGAGGTFTTNTKSINNLKGTGNLKDTSAKAVMSTGGEHKGYNKETAPKYPGAGGNPKDMGAPDNMVKGKAKGKKEGSGYPANNKGAKEVGTGKGGKGAATNDKALIGKKVR